jgi:hypothetical protein
MATTEDKRELGGDDAWKRELYEAAPERQGELFSTISGLENEPLYTPERVELDYDRDSARPRRRTSASATCSSTGRPDSRPPSTCRR